MGWYGVDLDGTLAYYDGWKGADHIGAPVPAMIERVKELLRKEQEVRIFTARVGPQKSQQERRMALVAIQGWCKKHLNIVLPVTATKDYAMIVLYDDRCVQIIPNTGKRADGEEW